LAIEKLSKPDRNEEKGMRRRRRRRNYPPAVARAGPGTVPGEGAGGTAESTAAEGTAAASTAAASTWAADLTAQPAQDLAGIREPHHRQAAPTALSFGAVQLLAVRMILRLGVGRSYL
jgi:hypothetical protein